MRRSESKALRAAIRPDARLARGSTGGLLLCALLGPILAGCSGPILTFRGQPAEAPVEPVSTGSIAKPPTSFGKDLDEEDWRRARAALAVALDPQGNGRPVKWENAESGRRGAVSPSGLPYVASDEVCRDFLASVVAPGASRFVRGTGCKPSGGEWRLKRLRSAKG